MALTHEGIVGFLESDIAVDTSDVTAETPLFSTGLIDSFAFVSLLAYIEDEESIRIAPEDVNLANLDTIARILAYAARSKAGQPG